MSPSVADTLFELFKWPCKVNLTLEDTTKGKKKIFIQIHSTLLKSSFKMTARNVHYSPFLVQAPMRLTTFECSPTVTIILSSFKRSRFSSVVAFSAVENRRRIVTAYDISVTELTGGFRARTKVLQTYEERKYWKTCLQHRLTIS